MKIITKSGSVYILETPGLVSRLSETPIIHRDGTDDTTIVFQKSVQDASNPTVGESWHVLCTDGYRFDTSPVVQIEERLF